MRKISVSVFLSVVDLCVVCQGKPPHPPPMGLICNVYTGSPPHDKRCRGTHSWCLLTLVPAPPEKVIPLQYPGERSCSSSLDKFKCVTRQVTRCPRLAPPLVTRWAHDCDPQLPPALKQHKLLTAACG